MSQRISHKSDSNSSTQITNTKQQPSFWLHFVAGGVAGTIGAAVTCPLEVVKTRLQSSLYRSHEKGIDWRRPISSTFGQFTGVVKLLGEIKQQEGIRALWKGLGPNLVGVVPARAIYFSAYSQGKHVYSSLNNGKETSFVHMCSAITAGISTAMFSNPIWMVKTRMQLQSELGEKKYQTSWQCLKLILKEEGVRGLYRGLSASFLGIGESTMQFVMYEEFKRRLVERKREELRNSSGDINASTSSLSPLETFGAAATAKLIAAIITYPHEVIRTRLRQTPVNGVRKYHGLYQSLTLIYREEGLAALYGGMSAHLMRVVPNAAILFFSYEAIVSFAKKMEMA